MRCSLAISSLVTLAIVATLSDAASRISIRVGSARYSYRYSYRASYRYTYIPSAPFYTRRLSVSVMGPVYFGYASRYPASFSYSRTPLGSTGTCKNYLALSNGSFIGSFSCPFLPDEPSNWTRCCGYDNEEFCCDPDYDDSWSNVSLSAGAIVGIVFGCLFGVGLIIAVFVICCCCCCRSKQGGKSDGSAAAHTQSKPFVETTGGRVEGTGPVPPPYPPMEYGTIPVQPQYGAGPTAPYPSPPPYGNSH